jgi:hypothetical protein
MAKEYTAEEIQAIVDKAVGPLKDKNKELLGKVAKNKQFEGVDLETLQAAATKLEELETTKTKEQGEWEKAYNKLKEKQGTLVTDLEAANVKLKADFDASKVKNEITIGLMGLDIIGDLSEVAVSTLVGQATLDDEGAVQFGDEKSADFMKKWAEGPVGKHFIKSGNSGGGGNGSESDKVTTEFEKYYKPESANQTKQLELSRTNPEVHKLLDTKYNTKEPLKYSNVGPN